MIQRYGIDCHAVTMYKIDNGGYYKVSDIDTLIEWRDFTETSNLKDDCRYMIWVEGEPDEMSAYFGDGEFHEDYGAIYTVEDRIKWKAMPTNPWTTK